MRGFLFGKVFIVTHAKKSFFSRVYASPLVTSGQRSVGLQPTPKHPAAGEKNPLVTRVRFSTTLTMTMLAKAAVIFFSRGCSMCLDG